MNPTTAASDDAQRVVEEEDLDDDAGIGMTSVVVMLAVLAALVVGIFWALPAWFRTVIEVTIRN